MALTSRVKELLAGAGLQRFLRLYESGVRGLTLYNVMRSWSAFQGLSPSESSEIYRRYRDIGAAGEFYSGLSAGERHLLKDIPINSKLKHVDLVNQRVNYFVRVQGRIGGEESIYERIIRVSSDRTLTHGEISNRLAPEFGALAYTEKGILASKAGLPIEFLTVEFIGVARIW